MLENGGVTILVGFVDNFHLFLLYFESLLLFFASKIMHLIVLFRFFSKTPFLLLKGLKKELGNTLAME